jgi:hypothetical protein
MNVWYVSYGSNICKDRFMCYINGEKPEGSVKQEKGCRDKTPPKADEKIDLTYPLYFAKEKSKWGTGGVAFIGHKELVEDKTIGRMYLITNEQFVDVVAQENNLDHLYINLNEVMEKGYKDMNDGWYGRIMYLGLKGDAPMFSFTNPKPIGADRFSLPSSAYLKTISKGLLEIGLSKEEIVLYFNQCSGIKDRFTNEELHQYIYGE